MRLFSWLFPRSSQRRKKPKTNADLQKKVQSVTIVQIDMGNVGCRSSATNWDALRGAIEKDIGEVKPYKRFAYRRVERNSQSTRNFLERATESWKEAGYSFSPNIVKGKDIDMPLAADLTLWLDELLEANDEVEVRHILASGDGDFAPFIRSKRHVFGKRLRLELIVYSWADSINPALIKLAGPGNIRYLDDIKNYGAE